MNVKATDTKAIAAILGRRGGTKNTPAQRQARAATSIARATGMFDRITPVQYRSELKELLNEADTAPVVKIIMRRGVAYRAELRRLKT